MNRITFAEFLIVFLIIGSLSWVLELVWLGWIGNGAVWLWARMKGVRLKSPSQDMLLHTLSPLVGLLGLPSAMAQILILYSADKVMGEKHT